MLRTLLLIHFFTGFLLTSIQAQQQVLKNADSSHAVFPTINYFCGTDALLTKNRKNPAYRTRENAGNRQIILSPEVPLDQVLTLPVVVHIINRTPETITDQMVTDGIKDLNDAFSKSGPYKVSIGADTKITFCLAKTDPDGGITTGITRTTHFYGNDHNPSLEESRLKSLIQWDPLHYINIWFIANMEDEILATFNCGTPGKQWVRLRIAAYATMPEAHGNPLDGIVTQTFGSPLAHEMGHYLGLYHTFEGGCYNNDCSVDGDRVCDTPPDNTFMSVCNQRENSCSTDSIGANPGFKRDQYDRTNNFMDYTGCPNEFTQGQADRMRKTILSIRNSLLVNKCDRPCSQNILAAFSRDNAYPTPGTKVNFTNTSVGANSYQWLVNDVAASASKDFSYTFSANGRTKITLKAYAGGTCFASYSDFVTVACSAAARFWADKRDIASKGGLYTDSILFTNASVNGTSFKWLLSNNQGMAEQVVSTTSGNLLYTFKTPATYQLRLIVANASCADTTGLYEIHVFDPTPDGISFVYVADCYQDTSARVEFSICNNGYMPLKKGAPVSFYDDDPSKPTAKKLEPTFYLPYDIGGGPGYYCCWSFTQIVHVGYRNLNQVYIVFNDSGTKAPVVLPNSGIVEKNYDNNTSSYSNFKYKITAYPDNSILAPEDTLVLNAYAQPGNRPSSFQWSPGYNLSCPNCGITNLYADTTSTKRVIGTSAYGCKDTAYVNIQVPPAYDFTVLLNDVECAANDDSLYVNFSLFNNFKREFLPKGLKVSFYKGNPATDTAVLLPPVFTVPATLRKKPFDYSLFIKGMPEGKLYAVVNDDGSGLPVKLPNDTTIKEINYGNNITSFNYKRLTVNAANTGPVCERDSVFFTASSIPAASYVWSGPANFSSNNQNPSINYTRPASTGKYFVTASKYGCTSVPDSTIVTIEEAPIVTADYTRPLCDTKPFQLTSASTNGVAYSWTGPNFTSNDQNPLIAVSSPANTGIYTLTVSSAKGCLSLPVSITATINPLPQPAFTDTNTCLPSTTAFFYNVSTIASGSITSYTWHFGDPASGSQDSLKQTNASHTFTKPGNYTITLTATSDRGCMASASNIFNRFHTKPKAEFSFSPADNLCVNDSIALTDGSNGADGNLVSWRWNLGDGTSIANNTNIAVTHRYQAAGNYRLSLFVTNSFSCGDTLQKQIIVYPLPIVDAGERQYILLGNSTLLNPTASGNGITYLWTPTTYINNNQIPAAVVVRPGDDILYTLTVTSIQQCKASDTVFIKVLKPLQIPNAFSPNGDGINDVWNVKYLADYPGAVVDIFDRYGRIVFHTVGYNKPWDGQRGGAPVPVGVYYYIITPKNGAAIVTGSLTVVR